MQLEYTFSITERKAKGKVSVIQEMVVSGNYDPEEDVLHEPEVKIYMDGRCLGEFSKLLDNASGDPLSAMIRAIDWREVYNDTKVHHNQYT